MIVKRGTCNYINCKTVCCENCVSLADNKCSIYSNRSNGCKVYPHNPMALELGCTYYFEEDNIKITAENIYTFSEEKRRAWLELFIEKSLDDII